MARKKRAAPRARRYTPLECTAYHEAGHAVVGIKKESLKKQWNAFDRWLRLATEDLVDFYAEQIEAVAEALLDQRTLSRKQVFEIMYRDDVVRRQQRRLAAAWKRLDEENRQALEKVNRR